MAQVTGSGGRLFPMRYTQSLKLLRNHAQNKQGEWLAFLYGTSRNDHATRKSDPMKVAMEAFSPLYISLI